MRCSPKRRRSWRRRPARPNQAKGRCASTRCTARTWPSCSGKLREPLRSGEREGRRRAMSAVPIRFGGHELLLDPLGAAVWPAAELVAVADLHLEKGSAAAACGSLVPPWDTAATLDRLAALLHRWRPAIVVALGDSFHDGAGFGRMRHGDAARLQAMAATARFVWVLGNHDPAPASGLAGEAAECWDFGGLAFCHQA